MSLNLSFTAIGAFGYGLTIGELKPLEALCGIMLGLVTIVMGLRLYVRLGITRTFGWDDGTMILAVVSLTRHSLYNILIVQDCVLGKCQLNCRVR